MRTMSFVTASASREKGFIYLDALLDLVLVAAVMPLIVLFYLQTAGFMEDLDAGKMEWRLFTTDLQSYLRDVDSVQIINGGAGIRVVQQGIEYDVEVNGAVIRKQKFGQGHEIMLTDVAACTFIIEGSMLKITALRSNGAEERSEYAITGP